MNVALLRRADTLARQDRFPSLLALLLVRHGGIVFEHYYRGFRGSDPLELFSITKSVTSAAIGIAIADGRIHSVDEPLTRFFRRELVGTPPRTGRLTLRELLTMTAGFPDEAARVHALLNGPRPTHALLTRPRTGTQGQFAYDSGSAQLVADAVAKAEQMPLAQLIRKRLFRPLGIADDTSWPADADGNSWGWAGLRLTARDLAKLGYLYLHRGRWHGTQILPAAWVDTSTAEHIHLQTPPFIGYGYFWWRLRVAQQAAYAALGAGGQVLLVVPDRDLVAVVGNRGSEDADDPMPILQLLVSAAH
jgi:CubicO group peptidase (beta-lactamase class C family)